MPLKKGTSDKTRSQNIAEMVKSSLVTKRPGRPQKQAVAAAYRQQRVSKAKGRK